MRQGDCPYTNKCYLAARGHRDMSKPKRYKSNYCFDRYFNCARYVMYKAGKKVPNDLLPNHQTKVQRLL